MKHLSLPALLASLLISSALLSCGTTEPAATETQAVTNDLADTAVITETAEPEIKPDIPERDFGGYEFHILNGNMSEWMMIYTVDAEEETGDALNDAIYRRNSAVEEQYNVSLVEINDTSAHTMAKKAVAAGDSQYDLLLTVKAQAGKLSCLLF